MALDPLIRAIGVIRGPFACSAGWDFQDLVHHPCAGTGKKYRIWNELTKKIFPGSILPPVRLVSFDFRAHHEIRRCESPLINSLSPLGEGRGEGGSFLEINLRLALSLTVRVTHPWPQRRETPGKS